MKLAPKLLRWWDKGHADLPWRRTRDPYAIWIAEVMLQQTQITTVIPYYERWMARFPTVEDLAEGSISEVLKLWEGLGYYGRARHLHAAARDVCAEHDGRLPSTVPELRKLKGIGPYTAGAIASIAFDQPVPVVDGNVIRVLSRLFDLEDDVTLSATQKDLWKWAGELVPLKRAGDYNQALMELGQTICQPARPRCDLCPLKSNCLARQRGTQMDRPVRPPRINTPHFDVVAAVIWRSPKPNSDSKFLITRRPFDGLLGGLWEFPGGKRQPGESDAQALVREIMEETALKIEPGLPLATVNHAYTHFRITLRAFHATWLGGTPQNIGVVDHAWVTLDQLSPYAFAATDRQLIDALRNHLRASTNGL